MIIATIVAISNALAAITAALSTVIASTVTASLTAVGVSTAVANVVGAVVGAIGANMIVGGALGTIGAAISGGNIGKGALYGAISYSIAAEVRGAFALIELMGGQTIAGIAKTAMLSYGAYNAYKNKDYFSATVFTLRAVNSAVKVAGQISSSIADSAPNNDFDPTDNIKTPNEVTDTLKIDIGVQPPSFGYIAIATSTLAPMPLSQQIGIYGPSHSTYSPFFGGIGNGIRKFLRVIFLILSLGTDPEKGPDDKPYDPNQNKNRRPPIMQKVDPKDYPTFF